MEQFEMDIESQTSEIAKMDPKEKDGLPTLARALIKLLTITFKCFLWIATMSF